ncbi:MAG TPA: stage II sporulation protein E [Candidatus Atribacteria bacterium]|nr:stage II sporulation protein E [Candidatus Atribacteria bacterium]
MAQRDAFIALNQVLESKPAKLKRKALTPEYLIEEVLLALCCFFIGRAVLFDELAPFGAVLFSVLLYKRYGGVNAFVSAALGLFTFRFGSFAFKYLVAMLLFALFWYIAGRRRFRWTVFRAALAVTLCMALANLIFILADGLLAYELLLGLFESIISFIMAYIFSRGADVLKEQRRRRILSGEEVICISIFISLLIIGFWNIHIFGLSLRSIFTVFITLLLAYIGGAGVGASIGITAGFMLSLTSSPDPLLMANLAVCGLLAGTFKELGRVGSCIAFMLANSLMTYYINRSTFVILPFGEVAAAILFVMVFPQKWILYLKQFLDYTFVRARNQQYYVSRMQELIVGRLKEFSQVFYHLSRVFGRMTGRKTASGNEELSRLFDLIAMQVCNNCALYRSCWERDFYMTYTNMFDMLTICEARGRVEREEMPDPLARKCMDPGLLLDAINSVYSAYRQNLKWQQRINDCRQLVAEQLNGVGKVITRLAEEIDMEVGFRQELEDSVRIELDRSGIRVPDVLVLEKPGGSMEICITKEACNGRRECIKKVEPIVSKVIGKPMASINRECTQGGKRICELRFVESRKFEVTTGIARKAKEGNTACGDSYSFTPIKNGRYLLALSDGMGSGIRAQEESSAVISLTENFLEAGFDQDVTIKTINSILMLRSRDEMYATADLCIIDLVGAGAEFIKIGGVASFLYRDGRVEIIKRTGLPIGILDDVEPENISCGLKDSDIIIMMTDGVLDAFSTEDNAEKITAAFIAGLNTVNPQEIADAVLEEALKRTGNTANDDMTVLAGRVWRPVA